MDGDDCVGRGRLLATRRSFTLALAGWAASSLSVQAQVAGRHYRVGLLALGSPDNPEVIADGLEFEREMARLGFVKGVNLTVDWRYASSDLPRLDALALELVALKPDAIVSASGTPGALALKKATTTIPIVFGLSGDPVGNNLVVSLAHPGRNLTGSISDAPQLSLKRLQILAEVLGKRATLAVLDPGWGWVNEKQYRDSVAETSHTPVAGLQFVEVSNRDDFGPAFERMARLRVDGVAINFSPLTAANIDLIGRLVVKHRLPAIADGAGYTQAGVLLAYSTDLADADRKAAGYVARILNGASPGDLPVEYLSHYLLTINMTTARSLGIRIPPAVLVRADKVLE